MRATVVRRDRGKRGRGEAGGREGHWNTLVFLSLSDPAKSTRLSFPSVTVPEWLLVLSIKMLKMRCDRELASLMAWPRMMRRLHPFR